MLHSILRNAPFSLLVTSILFSGILSIATAETTTTSPQSRPEIHDKRKPSETPLLKMRPKAGVMQAENASTSATDIRNKMGTSTPDMSTPPKNKQEMDAKRKTFEERAAKLRTNAAAHTEALKTHVEERRAHISEKVETKVRSVLANMQSRGTAAIEKLTALADRIESRAHKIQQQGVNVDAALALIAQARTELRAASVVFTENLAVETDTAVTEPEPKVAFEYVKESVRGAQEHMHAAQKVLHEAVVALKEVTPKEEGRGEHNATTTATTTEI